MNLELILRRIAYVIRYALWRGANVAVQTGRRLGDVVVFLSPTLSHEFLLRRACTGVGPTLVASFVFVVMQWAGVSITLRIFLLMFCCSWTLLSLFNTAFVAQHLQAEQKEADLWFDEWLASSWLHLSQPIRPEFRGSFTYMLLALPTTFAATFAFNYGSAGHYSILGCGDATIARQPNTTLLCGTENECCLIAPSLTGKYDTTFYFVGLFAGNWQTGMWIARAVAAFVDKYT